MSRKKLPRTPLNSHPNDAKFAAGVEVGQFEEACNHSISKLTSLPFSPRGLRGSFRSDSYSRSRTFVRNPGPPHRDGGPACIHRSSD